MDAKITIKMSNDAFGPTLQEGTDEVARILRKLADTLENDPYSNDLISLRDLNGNKVGEFRLVGTYGK